MTAPVTTPPSCSVWIDGIRMADGQPGEPDDAPCVLTDLKVVWGRATTIDQPTPGSATFKVLDLAGGQQFLDVIRLGSAVGIRTEGTVWDEPTVSMLPEGFAVASYWNATHAMVGDSLQIEPQSPGTGGVLVVLPPAAYSPDPSAWNEIPRSKANQTWQLTGSVTLHTDLGTVRQKLTIRPVYYSNPDGSGAVLGDPILTIGPGLSGPQPYSVSFTPADDVWVGIRYELWPTGPRWMDVPGDITWAGLHLDTGTRTNLATNPAPANVNGWGSNNNAKWTNAYAAGEVSVTRLAAADANQAASFVSSGLIVGNPVLTAGVNYQRSVEIWVDAAGSVGAVGGAGYTPGQALPANTWTRVVQQVIGTGVAGWVLAIMIAIPGVGPGVHVKARKGQLMVNPSGVTQPYFDGNTPDVPGGITYAWTGSPNASTSTAIDTPSVRWDELSTAILGPPTLLAPAAGVARAALVFSGHVTDLRASYDTGIGGTVVDVIASDYMANLANRYVGDQPWVAESLGARFSRVLSVAGQTINHTVDPAPAALSVTYRDVDSQPVARLLQELAISGAGVLWSATNLVTGEFLWLEDIGNRVALQVLTKDPDGWIRIHNASTDITGAVTISACSLLLEPVEWEQTYSDYSTQVGLTWLDQVVDPGPPAVTKPTGREITVVDANSEALTGRRRLSVSTQLSKQTEAQTIASTILGRLRVPGWRVSGLTWEMGPHEPITQAELGVLLTILDGTTRLGLPILLTDIPPWSPLGTQDHIPVYLEGARLSHHDGYWSIELVTSDARNQGSAAIPWTALPSDWLWTQFDPSVTWDALAGVSVQP